MHLGLLDEFRVDEICPPACLFLFGQRDSRHARPGRGKEFASRSPVWTLGADEGLFSIPRIRVAGGNVVGGSIVGFGLGL